MTWPSPQGHALHEMSSAHAPRGVDYGDPLACQKRTTHKSTSPVTAEPPPTGVKAHAGSSECSVKCSPPCRRRCLAAFASSSSLPPAPTSPLQASTRSSLAQLPSARKPSRWTTAAVLAQTMQRASGSSSSRTCAISKEESYPKHLSRVGPPTCGRACHHHRRRRRRHLHLLPHHRPRAVPSPRRSPTQSSLAQLESAHRHSHWRTAAPHA